MIYASTAVYSHLAFLQVAKLVNSSDIGADGRKKVFDAVGFSFINRLLATSQSSILYQIDHGWFDKNTNYVHDLCTL